MHSKIIQPGKGGKIVYDNKGSCASLISYLSHEAKENKVSFSFFNANSSTISPKEALSAIDHNVKSLRKNEVKFYSLVISPSEKELTHLQSRVDNKAPNTVEEKLKQFTCQTMENYAANFNLKQGKKLSGQDLLWFAVIHQSRQFKGNHEQVRSGEAITGELKPGRNAHVHIIVSKRDCSQNISLNPQGSRDRFEIIQWQKQNEHSFDQLFAYDRKVDQRMENKSKLSSEQTERFDKRIESRLSIINAMLEEGDKLCLQKVKQIAQSKGYKETFFFNLSRLENNIRKGEPVHDPLYVLSHNKDLKPERLQTSGLGAQVEKTLNVLSSEMSTFTEDLSIPDARPRFRRHLNTDELRKKAHPSLRQSL